MGGWVCGWVDGLNRYINNSAPILVRLWLELEAEIGNIKVYQISGFPLL